MSAVVCIQKPMASPPALLTGYTNLLIDRNYLKRSIAAAGLDPDDPRWPEPR